MANKIEVKVHKPQLILHKAAKETYTSVGPSVTVISAQPFMTEENEFKMLIWAAECQTYTILKKLAAFQGQFET